MQTDNNRQRLPLRRKGKRPGARLLKWVLTLVLALIVVTFFLVPVFVSSEKGRHAILARINNSVEGKAGIGKLSMSWFKGVKITDFSFNDTLGRISIAVKQIATKPHYASILFGNLSFGETVIDEPKVEIRLEGKHPVEANPVTVGQASKLKRPPAKETEPIVLPIKQIDMTVNNGQFKVIDPQGQSVKLSRINTKLNLKPPGQQTNFDLNMSVADGNKQSQIRAGGQLVPSRRNGWSLKGASGSLAVEVNDLDIESLGPFFALAGLEIEAKGTISTNLSADIEDGQI